jgi:hypothetical protein
MTARSGNRAARRRQKAELRRRPRMPSPHAIDAAIRYAGDNCSLCGRSFRHGERTRTGSVKGRLHVVGECCGSRVEWIFALGIYLIVDQPEPAHVRDDREWFEQHPRRTHRLRPAHPSEAAARWVAVRQVRPGYRHRVGFDPPFDPPDLEAYAHALFDLIAEAAQAGDVKVLATDIYQRATAMAREGRA